jgi:23S rRNA (pseudouridine1915-N3)-methyltransferase
MKIFIVTCGNLDSLQKKFFDEYKKRIIFAEILLKEINIKGDLEKNLRIQKESFEISKFISSQKNSSFDRVILLDIYGKNYSSEDFSEIIIRKSIDDSSIKNLFFIIGGAFGVNSEIRSFEKISFGLNTWPHNLMKIMLIEQIFRAQTIILNKSYHH